MFLLGSLFTEEQGLEKLLNLKGAKIVSLKNPKPGVWRLMMSSNGSHTLRVTGLVLCLLQVALDCVPSKAQMRLCRDQSLVSLTIATLVYFWYLISG